MYCKVLMVMMGMGWGKEASPSTNSKHCPNQSKLDPRRMIQVTCTLYGKAGLYEGMNLIRFEFSRSARSFAIVASN